MKNIIAILIILLFSVSGFTGESRAGDLEDSWAIRHIQRMIAKNASPFVEPKSKFYPKSFLNRGELAVLICRLLPNDFKTKTAFTEEYNAIYYFQEQKPLNFSDYKSSPVFGFVERAIKRKIMPPYKGLYAPDKLVTRGEFLKAVIILLEKTADKNCKIDGIAKKAFELNKHLTEYKDVSVRPDEYPGWVRTAQEYNLLTKRYDDSTSISAADSYMGIPYRLVFYNPQTKKYEFDAKRPITKELAMAILSNLFIKWDVYTEDVPYDSMIGNRAMNFSDRLAKDQTKVDSKVENIDVDRRIITVSSSARISKRQGSNVFKTEFSDDTEDFYVPKTTPIWLNYRGKWVELNNKDNLSMLATNLNRLGDHSLYKVKINILTAKKKYTVKDQEYIKVRNDENELVKIREASYIEVFAIPYEYSGRILAIRKSGIMISDYTQGNITLDFDKNTNISRRITSAGKMASSFDSCINPDNSNIYSSAWKALKVGEEVYVKVKRGENTTAKQVTSYFKRIGSPIQFDVDNSRIVTSHLVGAYYQLERDAFDKEYGTGFSGYLMTLNPAGDKLTVDNDIESIFLKNGEPDLNRILFVQPSEVKAINNGEQSSSANKIQFIISVSK